MATLQGGIFSRPRGKTGGIVFGAARTRTGKLVTSRLLVPPSNPNTAAQQTQRGIFSACQDIVRRLGASVYQVAWNRSVGQLPGFQSMQSIFMTQMDGSFDLTLVNDINLGTLEGLTNLEGGAVDNASIEWIWSDAVSGNGTAADEVYLISIAQSTAGRIPVGGVQIIGPALRSAESIVADGLLATTTYEFYIYAVGAGTAEGLTTIASALEETTLV